MATDSRSKANDTIIIARLYIYEFFIYCKRLGQVHSEGPKQATGSASGCIGRIATIGLACGTESQDESGSRYRIHAKRDLCCSCGMLRYKVTSPAGYSVYVELGTRKMKAQPFLGPAVKEESEALFKNLRKMFRR